MARVLVTGAAGFVASHLIARLSREGHQVTGADIRPRPVIPGLDPVDIDVNIAIADLTDPVAVSELVAATLPDGIVHAAGIVGPQAAEADPDRAVRVNVGATQHLLNACVRGGIRFTFLSTATVYGTDPGLRTLAETDLPRPVGIYDATKLMAETLLVAYKRTFGLVGASVRFGFPYGPGQSIDQYFIPTVARGKPIDEPAGADHPSDFTFIDDLVNGIDRVHTGAPPRHDVYNITGGVLRTRGEFAAAVLAAVPGARIHLGPGLQPGRNLRGACDLTRIHEEYGFEPQFTVEAGVAAWAQRIGLGRDS